MVDYVIDFALVLFYTMRDVLPIILLIIFFQLVVLKQPIPHLKKMILGGIYVVLGLALFLMGLEKALFPVGKIMAAQLSDPSFIGATETEFTNWQSYYWIYIFAALIGFATTIAEPSLIAVAIKADEVSAGTINQWGLRVTVALGVSFALALGTFRIVTGTPLFIYIMVGYVIVIIQTFLPQKNLLR